jgi:hypothetical protein
MKPSHQNRSHALHLAGPRKEFPRTVLVQQRLEDLLLAVQHAVFELLQRQQEM